MSAPRDPVPASAFRKLDALEDKARSEGRSMKPRAEGLPEPKVKCEADQLEIRVDVAEYRCATIIRNMFFPLGQPTQG